MIDLNFLTYYILTGTLWCFICDNFMVKMDSNMTRVRYILFWPYTLVAFIIGFINALIESYNDE